MFAGFRLSATAALLFAICLTSTSAVTLTQTDYNNICLLTQTGELISTGDSCTNYYYCQNGVAILQSCPQGLSFSKDAQSCLPESIVNCGQVGVDPCSSTNVGQWAPVAGSCSGFYYCSAKGGMRGNCPLGENFNPQTQSCEFASTYPCAVINQPGTGDSTDSSEQPGQESGVNLCAFMPNNVFFGSASDCAGYNVCQNNVLTTGSCPSGYNFNPAIGKCDYAQNVNCAQVSNDPNLVYSPSIGAKCTQVGAMTSAAQCNAYYLCNGVNYILNYCPSGLYYDINSKTCMSRMNAVNNCDRCIGTKLSFVNAPSRNGCAGYLYCQNGIEKGTGTCGAGSYFNELAGACVAGPQPNFGCCNPNFASGTTSTSTTATTTSTTSTAAPPVVNKPNTDGSTNPDTSANASGNTNTNGSTNPDTSANASGNTSTNGNTNPDTSANAANTNASGSNDATNTKDA